MYDAIEHICVVELVKYSSFILMLAACLAAFFVTDSSTAITQNEILQKNSASVVYIEITDAQGGIIDHGTGFVVSHDGYVLTAAHLKVDATQTMWAVVGQRQGVRYRLSFRESDEQSDVALWQLPAALICRPAVTISTKPVAQLDRVLAVGFPDNQDLSASPFGISNTSSALGFFKADGMLQPGNSGGPVFNEEGQVIGIVQGGTMPGTNNNDIVPIAPAIALLQKRGVSAGIGAPVVFASSCYGSCRVPENGIETWTVTKPWGPVNSGWVDGGHDQSTECDKLIAGALANNPSAQIALNPGRAGKWEESDKDWLGHVERRYFCAGVFRSGPVYAEARSPACGLRQ